MTKISAQLKQTLLAATILAALSPMAWADEAALPHGVKIGVLNDRSGPYADASGEGSAVAARMAVEEVGGKVLGQPIEIIVGDHTGKADLGALIARKWFDEENVDAIADIAASGVGLAVVGVAKERNKIVLNNSASSDFTGKACTPTSVQWSYNTYANSNALASGLKRAGLDSVFTILVDYAYGKSLAAGVKQFVEADGGKIVGEVAHPLNTMDFSSYLLQAQSSGADLVGVIKQANEFGLPRTQTLVVAAAINLTEVESLGLSTAQGLLSTSAFEWTKSDESRAWTKEFVKRMGKFPTADQAATYSEVKHYLKAIAAAHSLDPAVVIAKMRELPINDMFATNGHLREDGQMVHNLYLVRVKKPEESKEKGDDLAIIQDIPGEEIFQTLAQSACPLLKK